MRALPGGSGVGFDPGATGEVGGDLGEDPLSLLESGEDFDAGALAGAGADDSQVGDVFVIDHGGVAQLPPLEDAALWNPDRTAGGTRQEGASELAGEQGFFGRQVEFDQEGAAAGIGGGRDFGDGAFDIDAAGLDREVLADRVVKAAVKMMMIDGFFHGDPHPGNVFVDLDNGDMVMLDTGMVGELSFQQRVKLGSLLLTVRNGDVEGLAQTLKSLSTPYRETNDEQYYQDFARTLTPYLDPPPGQKVEVVAKVLPLGLDILQEAGYRFDSQLTLAMKAMAQAEAITGALVPEWTGTEFMKRSFDALLTQVPQAITSDVVKDAVMRQAGYVAREAIEQLPMLQSGAFKWLDNLKKGGVKVELDTSGLNEQLQALRGIAMMITLGILVVGMVVGSALAAGVGGLEGSALEPVTDLAAFIFALSAVVGGIAVVVLAWRLWRLSRPRSRGRLDRI